MRRLIEKKLKHARMAGAAAAANHFNPLVEMTTQAIVVKTIYVSRALDSTIQAPDCVLTYDREDFLELLGNLVDTPGK